MQAVKEKLIHFRRLCYKNGYLFAAFFIPIAVMIVGYINFGMWPIGERSVLCLDLNAQYVFYFDYVHDVIGNGESLLYSWSRNLSGEFIGIIGYYLASPFNLLVWLFPREMITEGLMTMMLAKFGACGVCFAIYAHKSRKLSKHTAALFSLMYSLCAYMVVETMNPMWLDGVLILPLVCFGIEALVRENRFKLLVISLCYAFISNFYIGFMIAIFTVIYFLYYFFANAEYKNAKGLIGSLIKKGAFTGLCGITSALISAFMILPVYSALQNGKFTFTTPDYTFKSNYDLLDIATKLFPNSYDTVRMEGLPFIFCGSVALILTAGYFCSRKFRFSQKISAAALIGAMLICMYIRPIDMMWHGGQMPNWLPYRYSFIISFILVMLSAQAFEELKSISKKTLGLITVCYIGLIIYIESTDTFNSALGNEGRELFDGISVALPAILFMAIAGITLYLISVKHDTKKLTKAASIGLCAVIVAELCFNTAATIKKMHTDIVFSTRASYLDVVLPLREKVEQIKEKDEGFYRIEKNFFRSVNDPIATGMYGLSHSSSTLNAKAIDMLGFFGFTSNGHYSRFSGNTPVTSDIFGVKYILDCKDHNTVNIKSEADITVTENPDAMPITFLSDMGIENMELSKDMVFENQNLLISYLTGIHDEYFKTFAADGLPTIKNCTKGNYAGGHIGFTNPKDEASVTYRITAIADGDIYMYVPTDYQRQVTVYVNEKYIGAMFESDNHNIKNLGNFKKGEQVEVRMRLDKNDLYFKTPQFATLDTEKYNNAISALQQMNNATTVEKLSGTEVVANVTATKDQMLFTTIPYEQGWTIYVDGVETKPVKLVEEALMGIPITAGDHKVEFKFFPARMDLGIICTICGILIFVCLILIDIKFKTPIKLKVADASKVIDSEEELYNEDETEETEQSEKKTDTE